MSNYELKDHVTRHSGQNNFVCEICGNAHPQRTHLASHKRMSAIADTRNPGQPLFVDCKGDSNIGYHPEDSIQIKSPLISDEEMDDDDDEYAYAKEELEGEDYQSDVDKDSNIRITSCRSLSNEIHDDSLSSRVKTEVSDDSTTDPANDGPVASRIPTVVVPVINQETKMIKNTVVPVDMIDDTGLNIIKSVLIPMPTSDGSTCYEVRKVLVPIQSQRSLPVRPLPKVPIPPLNYRGKMPIQPPPSLPVQTPPEPWTPPKDPVPTKPPTIKLNKSPTNPTTNLPAKSSNKIRKILPKLMPIETVREPCVEAVKEQVEETEDPLKDKKIIGDDLDAMDKMLDDLRNTCPLCQLSFNTQHQMDRHFRRRHKNQFRCKKCHFSYDSAEALEDHEKIHDQDTYIECNLCHRKYKRMSGLMAHRVRKHTTEDPQSLRDQVPEERVPNFSAEDPDNTWGRRQVLGRSYSCGKCNNVYPRKSFLIAHERIAHGIGIDDSKPLQCNICNKTFPNRKQYYKHDRSHTKIYLCSLCGKELRSEASLRLHNMRHTGERPFACQVCGKCFTAKVTLKVHELIHSGLRPYICNICGQSFTQRSSMMMHHKKHPGNHPPPPRVNLVNIQKR